MKSFRQLLRQPIKFLAGLILMTVAAAILCVCVGQALAAKNTADVLDRRFTTVAIPAQHVSASINGDSITLNSPMLPKDLCQWLEETAQSDSKVIKTVARHGIVSAHIPEMRPLNYTQSDFIPECFGDRNMMFYRYLSVPDGVPYSCAMLVFTLEEISEPAELIMSGTKGEPISIRDFRSEDVYRAWLDMMGNQKITAGYTVNLAGTVTEVVSLQEGYRDPTGMTARLTMTVPNLEELEALDLQPGESYLVYGMNYYDEDWALRGYLADERKSPSVQIDQFDLKKLYYLSDREKEATNHRYAARYDGWVYLKQTEVDQINAISMTLATNLQLNHIGDSYFGDRYAVNIEPNVTYTDRNGETITMTMEEYTDRYRIPTIARLEGSVEDFLQSEEGALWQQALERDEINNHAFAVIGVDEIEYLAYFAQEEAAITQGRDFTEEEQRSGARVCILNEAVAVANGLEVGDTVTLNLYHGDPGLPYQESRLDYVGILAPSADFYFNTTPIEETAEYTVVGFWRSKDTWVDVGLNEYGFNPNTVFVPKTSVTTPLEYPDSILFTTVVLYNGRQEEFLTLAKEAGFANPFVFYDQGYSTIATNFHNYEALAQQTLAVGASVYAVILLLFLLLFPGTQRKTAEIMESLGVTRGKRLTHVMFSAIGIAAPATVLGGGMGLLLWQSVLDALQESAETAVALQLDSRTLLLLALAQFVFTMVLTAIIAVWVTAPRGMSKRRSK